ncbi:MAG: protein translocase subunit SecF [Chloroflexota bacterium]|nr:protein translocase subunit SecF [Chloroflexota bacterium]
MIDFVGKRSWFFFISVIILIAGIASLAIFGLKPGVDFAGGTSLTMELSAPIEQTQMREEMAELGYDKATIQRMDEDKFLIRLKEISPQERDKLVDDLEASLGCQIKIIDYYAVSATVGTETARNAAIAVIIAAVAMLFYVVWAFRRMPKPFRWGTCAVIAILHDVLIVIGVFSFLGWVVGVEIDALFITGLLAVVGYSINNTVVVFDRIRENMTKGISPDFSQTVNSSILETLGRCLNTSMTTLFVVLALFLFGGATIHYFVLVLLLGIIVGTYTSVCIAGELLVMWEKHEWTKLYSWIPFVKRAT